MQQEPNVVALAEVSEAEALAQPDDSSSSSAASVHSDSAGSVHGSEPESVDSVTIHDEIMGINATSLAEWAWANTPRSLAPEKRQEYVELLLEAAAIYEEMEEQAGAESSRLDLYVIDEGDGESAGSA